jgi:hypothetical protein
MLRIDIFFRVPVVPPIPGALLIPGPPSFGILEQTEEKVVRDGREGRKKTSEPLLERWRGVTIEKITRGRKERLHC